MRAAPSRSAGAATPVVGSGSATAPLVVLVLCTVPLPGPWDDAEPFGVLARARAGRGDLRALAQLPQRVVDLGPQAAAFRRRRDRSPPFLLDLQVHLLAEHGDVPWRLDTDANLLAHDRQHRNLDVVPDHD